MGRRNGKGMSRGGRWLRESLGSREGKEKPERLDTFQICRQTAYMCVYIHPSNLGEWGKGWIGNGARRRIRHAKICVSPAAKRRAVHRGDSFPTALTTWYGKNWGKTCQPFIERESSERRDTSMQPSYVRETIGNTYSNCFTGVTTSV